MQKLYQQLLHTVDHYRHRIKEADLQQMPYWKSAIIHSIRIVMAVLRDLTDGQLNLRAMSLVYTTVISLVPLLALSFSILKGLGVHNKIEPMLLNALKPLGGKGIEITSKIIQFVENVKVGILGAVGLALLIITVVSMMQKIEHSFNYTWRITQHRSFAQRFSDYLSVLCIGPLFIFLSIALTTSLRSNAMVDSLTQVPMMHHVLDFLNSITPYILMTIGFAFFYFFIPNAKVNIRSALIGGLITTFIWKFMGWLFAEFISIANHQTAIYSAFAAIIIFMLWLYLGWLVLLVGASIAYYDQHPQHLFTSLTQPSLSNRLKEKLALALMYYIGQNFTQNQQAWSIDKLANQLRLPANVIEPIIKQLIQNGLLVRSGEDVVCLYPAKPLTNISVNEVLHIIRCADEKDDINNEQVPLPENIKQVFLRQEEMYATEWENVTVADLLEKNLTDNIDHKPLN